MKSTPSPARIATFAFALIAVGFVLGIGYQTLQYANLQSGKSRNQNSSGDNSSENQVDEKPPPAPVVRGLRVSPDDRLLAFNAIYGATSGQSQQAGRFVFDLKTYHWNEVKSPDGWQDSITQWSRDGTSLLFARERIPRAGGNGEPGLYGEKIGIRQSAAPEKTIARSTPQALSSEAEPPGEKAYAGFWTPDGKLVMKTRRESKALFLKADKNNGGEAEVVDRSPGTYYQNRAVMENGALAYYVVRDISVADGTVGLFRVSAGKSRPVGSTLRDVVWAYLAENARWMIVCRYAENGRDWQWSLHQISPTKSQVVRQVTVPEDVITVYWSPDFKKILGAAGKSLWLIEVPSLKMKKLGERDDWNADDAAWLGKQNAVLVAASGRLWKVNVASGKRTEVWKFPDEYWR